MTTSPSEPVDNPQLPDDTEAQAPPGAPLKDPENWATGDEPATQAQLSYLETLATDSGVDVPRDLTKARASQLIDELRERSPRLADGTS